jgi:DNA-binding GntR family transcriptional regulator
MAKPRVNRSEQAYSYVLDELLRGRWQAGDTLSTYALAEELGISRTPVLEALKRLESDGLVEIIPQVGCRIVRPSLDDVEELFALRAALEGLAAERAAQRIDDNALAAIADMTAQLEAAAARGDHSAYEQLDQRFHAALVEASRMRRLPQAMQSVMSPLRYVAGRLSFMAQDYDHALPEHRELLEALQQRDPERARAAAERHARQSCERFVAYTKDEGTAAPASLVHQTLMYGSDDEFIAATVPFLVEGLDAGERTLVVTTAHNAALLERELGARTAELELRDSSEWYRDLSSALLSYQRYVADAHPGRVRILGEPTSNGRAAGRIDELKRYETMLGVALAIAPVSLLCPYDVRTVPSAMLDAARQTHPEVRADGHVMPSPHYQDAFASAPAGGGTVTK